MPDTTPAAARIRELEAQRDSYLAAVVELQAGIAAEFELFYAAIAPIAAQLKRERGRDVTRRAMQGKK